MLMKLFIAAGRMRGMGKGGIGLLVGLLMLIGCRAEAKGTEPRLQEIEAVGGSDDMDLRGRSSVDGTEPPTMEALQQMANGTITLSQGKASYNVTIEHGGERYNFIGDVLLDGKPSVMGPISCGTRKKIHWQQVDEWTGNIICGEKP